MKHLSRLVPDLEQLTWIEQVPEGADVLLQGQPFSNQTMVFVSIGYLQNSEDFAAKIGSYVHGRRWGKITRNDGHYIEIETEDHRDDKEASNAQS